MSDKLPKGATQVAPSKKSTTDLEMVVRRAAALKREIERLEDEQKKASQELAKILRHRLPDMMAEIGVDNFGVDGHKIASGLKVAGTLNRSPDEDAAVVHLEEDLGFEGGVRTVLTVEFSETERNMAGDCAGLIYEKYGRPAEAKRDVHPSTLAAFARKCLEEGKEVDLDLLGLASWREARFTKFAKPKKDEG